MSSQAYDRTGPPSPHLSTKSSLWPERWCLERRRGLDLQQQPRSLNRVCARGREAAATTQPEAGRQGTSEPAPPPSALPEAVSLQVSGPTRGLPRCQDASGH